MEWNEMRHNPMTHRRRPRRIRGVHGGAQRRDSHTGGPQIRQRACANGGGVMRGQANAARAPPQTKLSDQYYMCMQQLAEQNRPTCRAPVVISDTC